MFSYKKIISKKYALLLASILVIALFLRIFGINFGLPYIYDPDEPYFVKPAINMLTGDLNPHAFGHPGSTVMYVLYFVYGTFYRLGLMDESIPDIQSVTIFYENNPAMFHLLGRFLIVFFAIASVFLVYKVGVRISDRKLGLIAALFLAVNPLHIKYSQIIRTDIPQTFFILLCVLFCLLIYHRKKRKHYILAGLFAGLATATKFPSIVVVIPIILAHYFNEGDKLYKEGKNLFSRYWAFSGLMVIGGVFILAGSFMDPSTVSDFVINNLSSDKVLESATLSAIEKLPSITFKLGVMIVILVTLLKWVGPFGKTITNLLNNKNSLYALSFVIIGFFLGAPYFLIDFPHAIADMIIEATYTHPGFENSSKLGNLLWYISSPLNLGMGGSLLELIAMSGIVYAVVKKRKAYLIIVSFLLVYFLIVILNRIQMDRYVITLIPFLAIFSTVFLLVSIEKMRATSFKKYEGLILTFSVLCLAIFPAYKSFAYSHFISQKDTRTLAKEWIEENIPRGSKIWLDQYSPPLSDEKYDLESVPLMSIDHVNDIRHFYNMERVISEHTEYVIISSLVYDRYNRNKVLYPEPAKFYASLESEHSLIKIIHPDKIRPGPTIKINRLSKSIIPTD